MNNFPRYTELRLKDVYLDIAGRFLGVFTLAFPFIWFYGLNAIGTGNKVFAVISALTLTAMETISLFFIMKGLYKLIHHYTKHTGVLRILICLFALYIPYLEIRYLIKDKYTDIIVPAFVQPRIGNSNSVFVSLMCFIDGLPLMSSNKLANHPKDKGYFSVVDDDYDPAVTINTNVGLFMCLIKPTSLYIFKELDYGEQYGMPQDSKWRLEHSYDKTTSAIVYEQDFDPLWENEKTLSLDIVRALSELEAYHRTN